MQVSPTGASECRCVASNLELCGGDDVGWGPGVEAFSKETTGWSRPFNQMLARGIFVVEEKARASVDVYGES